MSASSKTQRPSNNTDIVLAGVAIAVIAVVIVLLMIDIPLLGDAPKGVHVGPATTLSIIKMDMQTHRSLISLWVLLGVELAVLISVGYFAYEYYHGRKAHGKTNKAATKKVREQAKQNFVDKETWEKNLSANALYSMAHILRPDLIKKPIKPNTKLNSKGYPHCEDKYGLAIEPTSIGSMIGTNDKYPYNGETWLSYERSILVIGPPRSGKNLWFVNRWIGEHEGPVITTAVRPDVFSMTAAHRERKGTIYLFDPFELCKNEPLVIDEKVRPLRWSPLWKADEVDMALAHANFLAMQGAGKGENASVERYYREMVAMILAGMLHLTAISKGATLNDIVPRLRDWGKNEKTNQILKTFVEKCFNEEEKRSLEQEVAALRGRTDRNEKNDRDMIAEETVEWFKGRKTSRAVESIYYAMVSVQAAMSTETFKAYFGSFMTQVLRPLQNPKLLAALQAPEGEEYFDPMEFLSGSNTLYIIGNEASQAESAPIIVGIVEDILRSVTDYIGQNARNPRLSPPLGLYLDELPSVVPLPEETIRSLLTTGAGNGIRFVGVVQGTELLEQRWGPQLGKSLITTAGAVIVLPGVVDTMLLRQLSEVAGQAYVDVPVGDDDHTTKTMVPVLMPEEIRMLEQGHALIFVANLPPMEVVGMKTIDTWWYKAHNVPKDTQNEALKGWKSLVFAKRP